MNPLEFLKSGEYDLKFRWIDKQTFAQIDFEKQVVSMNLTLMLAYFFTHEYLHYVHPDWSEGKVKRYTNVYTDRMTEKDIKALARAIRRRR